MLRKRNADGVPFGQSIYNLISSGPQEPFQCTARDPYSAGGVFVVEIHYIAETHSLELVDGEFGNVDSGK